MGLEPLKPEAASMTERQLGASLLAEISRSEHHFNALEAEYRKLASQWLLAAFAAMGFIATAKDLPLPAGPTIFVIALGASLGVQLLWIVDLLAYHRLLLAYFLEGLRIERLHSTLPQVRSNMLAQGSTGKLVRLFYLMSSLVPLAFGVGAYFLLNHIQTSVLSDVLVLLVTLGFLTSSGVLMAKTPSKWVHAQIALLDHPSEQQSPSELQPPETPSSP